jgi:hypothetical protein
MMEQIWPKEEGSRKYGQIQILLLMLSFRNPSNTNMKANTIYYNSFIKTTAEFQEKYVLAYRLQEKRIQESCNSSASQVVFTSPAI